MTEKPSNDGLIRIGSGAIARYSNALVRRAVQELQNPSSIEVECDFELKWRLAVRSSCHICKTAMRFDSTIEITHGDETIDAKSVVAVCNLGLWESLGTVYMEASDKGDTSLIEAISRSWTGLKAGSKIKIVARGVDAAAALAALVADLSNSDLDYGPGVSYNHSSEVASQKNLPTHKADGKLSNRPKRVLLIAERDTFGNLFTEMLAAEGIEVHVVECYVHLELVYVELLRRSYDMVVPTNNAMSPFDIPALVSKIKTDHPGVKILVLSGYSPPKYVSELQELGIDEFKEMATNGSDIIASVKKHLSM